MKKQVTLLMAVLVSITILMGCGASFGNDIVISFSGAPETHEQSFVSSGKSVSFLGTISVIGSARLCVLSADGSELFGESFEDVRNEELDIEVGGLTPGGEYTLKLDGINAVSCSVSLSTAERLVETVPREAAAKPAK